MEKIDNDKVEKEKINDSLIINSEEVNPELKEKGEYTSIKNNEEIHIVITENQVLPPIAASKNKEKVDIQQLYVKLKKQNIYYEGYTNLFYKRHGIGLNQYDNGDIYLGHWNFDVREGRGLYKYNTNSDKSEYYFGNFQQDKRFSKGCYFWFKEDSFLNDFASSKFDLLIGSVDEEENFEYETIY